MAHTGLSAAFYLLHTSVGDSAMNKFETCREVNTIRILIFSVDNGAMNAPQCWQLRDDVAYSDVGTRAVTLPTIPMEWWISFLPCKFVSELPTAVRNGAESLKGSHRMQTIMTLATYDLRVRKWYLRGRQERDEVATRPVLVQWNL